MIAVRRWYIYLVCAVSLQSVTWAAITLIRNLLVAGGSAPTVTIALQIAIILVGLPLFLVHWLWAQRLAAQSPDERGAVVRRLYLYGMLSALIAPFIANTFDLLRELLWLALGAATGPYSPTEVVTRDLVAMVVLTLLWFYHWRVVCADANFVPETGSAAAVRRLYLLAFSAAGTTMTALAIIHLLRLIMFQFGGGAAISGGSTVGLSAEVARLIVGLPLWLSFWGRAQRMFTGASEAERESALRKFYLYLAVFIATLTTVTNATLILAGLFRHLLDLPSRGDVRIPLPIIIGMSVVWAYHAYILRGDAAAAREAPQQAAIRRLYLYLVAAIGLAAFLVGLGGDISVVIRSVAERSIGEALREQVAWFTAALIAGLPVWLLPWRQAQIRAVALTSAGADERRSVVRKVYLYFFLFVATMTVLASMVYIVWQLLSLALGEQPKVSLPSDLAQSIAFSVIGVGVWLHNGSALRGDSRCAQRERTERLGTMRVAVVDAGEGRLGRAVLDGLRHDMPGLALDPIGLTQIAADTMGMDTPIGDLQTSIVRRLTESALIVGPWEVAVPGGASGTIPADIAGAVVASPALKLLVPIRAEGWEWAGVDQWDAEAIARQTVRAVSQVATGEKVKPARPLSAGAIVAIAVGLIILLSLLAIPVLYFFSRF